MREHEKHSGVQVIAKAAAVMRALGEHPKGLSLAGIAKLVGLPRSTVQRIVTALQEELLVEALGSGTGFRLGPALGELMSQAQSDIVSIASPVIDELSEQIEESVALSTLAANKILIVYCAVSEKELRIVFPIGVHGSIFSTSVGKIYLSKHSDSALEILIPTTLHKHTPLTLNREELISDIKRIRTQGYATETEEYIEGVYSMSLELSTHLGRYAISIIAPASRAAKREAELLSALRVAKDKIERSACYMPSQVQENA